MRFIDTHTHIYLEQFDADRADSISLANAAGVDRLLMPNVDASTIEAMMQVAGDYPGRCLPMMALHPTSVKQDYRRQLDEISDWFDRENFVAVGETGIDLYWDKTHFNEQIVSFQEHIGLAIKYNLPLVIHSRKSLNEIFMVLRDYQGEGLRGVFHCFPGNVPDAIKAIELGFMLGIGGVVTYKNSTMARVVEAVGLDHIVLETDAPYLPPVPHRGKRNESAWIPIIAEKIAELLKVSTDRVATATTANAVKLFGL